MVGLLKIVGNAFFHIIIYFFYRYAMFFETFLRTYPLSSFYQKVIFISNKLNMIQFIKFVLYLIIVTNDLFLSKIISKAYIKLLD